MVPGIVTRKSVHIHGVLRYHPWYLAQGVAVPRPPAPPAPVRGVLRPLVPARPRSPRPSRPARAGRSRGSRSSPEPTPTPDREDTTVDFPTQLFVDGEWQDASDGATFDVIDPATGEVVAQVADATEDDVRAMIDGAAARPGLAGPRRPPSSGPPIMRRAARIFEERLDELARLLSREQGKPVAAGGRGAAVRHRLHRLVRRGGPPGPRHDHPGHDARPSGSSRSSSRSA